jgi:endogenous inhibitor of DNA gyrase (YacG/DUF329 family)
MICLVTEYVAANCSVCGKPAEPVHIVQDRLYCTAHCPIKHLVNIHPAAEKVA